jgi:predicted amidophosphoribosyltransferase
MQEVRIECSSGKRVAIMQQRYFCPNCKSLVNYVDRYCRNCGTNLYPASAQAGSYAAPAFHSCNDNGESVQCNHNQYKKHYLSDSHVAFSENKCSSVGNAKAPIRAEIIKLIADLVQK